MRSQVNPMCMIMSQVYAPVHTAIDFNFDTIFPVFLHVCICTNNISQLQYFKRLVFNKQFQYKHEYTEVQT